MQSNFCIINSYKTLKEFLNKELLFSSNLIKKHFKNKKILQKTVDKCSEWDLPLDLLNNEFISPIYDGPELTIIDEDKDFIVINKPPFMHGHPLSYNEDHTVLNFLRSSYNLKWHEDWGQEKGLLYRLDEQTSGVLIFVKDKELHVKMREQFNEIANKKYIALVEGHLDIDRELKHYLVGSDVKGSKVVEGENGRGCSCHVKTLKFVGDKTLVEVRLHTGFRHQIRVQLSLIGHPIVGDTLYGAKEAKRIFLHAYEYDLMINGQQKCWQSKRELFFNDFLDLDSRFEVF